MKTVKKRFKWEMTVTVALLVLVGGAFYGFHRYRISHLNEAVSQAAMNNDLDRLKSLIWWGANPEGNTDNCDRALKYAVEHRNLDMISFILNNIDWNGEFQDKIFITCLEQREFQMIDSAIAHLSSPKEARFNNNILNHLVDAKNQGHISTDEQIATAKNALKYGLDIDYYRRFDEAPIDRAAKFNQREFALFLADKDTRVQFDVTANSCSALDYAYLNNNESLAKSLEARGWKKTIRTAIILNDIELVEILSMQSSFDKELTESVFEFAFETGSPELVVKLISICQKQFIRMADYGSLLRLRLLKGDVKLIQQLAEYGIDLDTVKIKSQPLLHFAVQNNLKGLMHFLISRGLDVNHPNDEGATPLMLAIGTGSMESVITLVECGADVNRISIVKRSFVDCFENKDKEAAKRLQMAPHTKHFSNIEAACISDEPEILTYLIETGAKIENPPATNGLGFAVRGNRFDQCGKILMNTGATLVDNHVADKMLSRAMSLEPDSQVLKFLLEQGADPTYKPNTNRFDRVQSALEIAKFEGEIDIYNLMLQYIPPDQQQVRDSKKDANNCKD